MDDFVTDLELQALVDGELDDARAAQVMRIVMSDPELFQRYGELVRQRQQLQRWWRHEDR